MIIYKKFFLIYVYIFKKGSMVGQLGRTGRTGVITGFTEGKNETFFDKW